MPVVREFVACSVDGGWMMECVVSSTAQDNSAIAADVCVCVCWAYAGSCTAGEEKVHVRMVVVLFSEAC